MYGNRNCFRDGQEVNRIKVSFYVIIFMIAFGVADVVLKEARMEGYAIEPFDEDQITDALNGTRIVESWNPSLNPFYDIGAGLGYMWNILGAVILAFPATLTAYGLPSGIVDSVNVLYSLVVVGVIIEFISGREFMP